MRHPQGAGRKTRSELTCGLTHLVGAMLSIVGLVVLLRLTVAHPQPWHLTAFAVFGASLVLLYGASTLYHLIPLASRAKPILRRVDHSMIYVLIAGTYTPICLIPLRGVWGWSALGTVWGLALAGVGIKALGVKLPGWLSATTYVGLGWLSVLLLPLLWGVLPGGGIGWLALGGAFYTVGVVFFGLEKVLPPHRWNGMHEVFHLLVMAGSFSHFWLMWRYVLPLG